MYLPDYVVLRNIVSHEETRYEFRQGMPVVVVGDNRDNPSQKGNGSGKSAINEGIVIAVTGGSIRNASMKKLVRRGCDFGEVEFGMHNAMYRADIKIIRKLYANGKSQEVRIWCNDEQIVLSDVNEYNKWIFEMLDISKEDFFNFYVITKEYYKPYLAVGDTVKKEIINRFSGAEKVDAVTPAIDTDVAEAELKVGRLKTLININQGKQQVVSDQIVKLQVEVDPSRLEAQKAALTMELSEKLEEAENHNYVIDEEALLLADAKKALEKFEPEDFDLAILLEQGTIDTIKKANDERRLRIPKVKEEFAAEIEKIKKSEQECDQSLIDERAILKEAEQILADLNNQLAGTIECPKCSHEFILADAAFDIEQAKKDVEQCEIAIVETKANIIIYEDSKNTIREQKEEVNQKVATKSQEIREEIAKEQDRISKFQEEIAKYQEKKRQQAFDKRKLEDAVSDSERKISLYQRAQEDLIQECEKLALQVDAVVDDNASKIEALETQLLEYLDESDEIQVQLGEAEVKVQEVKEWYGNFKSFKSYLANKSIRNVQDYTNMYLQQMGSDLSIEIDGYKKQSTGKIKEQINTIVCRGGFAEDEYGTYSGGERGRIDVAVILAIQQLINLNSTSGGLDLLVADEIFDSIDSLGLEHIVQGLLHTQRTVMFISQVQTHTLKEHTLVVKKENKISTICQ